nr:MAG TPA: hypothetical protein [Caudoviricetes sp.]
MHILRIIVLFTVISFFIIFHFIFYQEVCENCESLVISYLQHATLVYNMYTRYIV